MAEIKRLANEVGIESNSVESAAKEVGGRPRALRPFRILGAPIREVYEVSVDGLLSNTAWEDVVSELRVAFGNVGTVTQVASSREWLGGTDMRAAHFSATPRRGRTRIQLSLNQQGGVIMGWAGASLLSFIGAMVGAIFQSNLHYSGLVVLCAVLAMAAVLLGIAGRLLAGWHRKNREMVTDLISRIGQLTNVEVPAHGHGELSIEERSPEEDTELREQR